MRIITVLLVEDNVFVMKSLQSMLEGAEDIQIVATASNGREAIDRAGRYCPDVAVMDISMPLMDGIEATKQILNLCGKTRVTMLSIFDQPHYVQRALEMGAAGYVLKDAIAQDLLKAIRALASGKQFFSSKIADVAARYARQSGLGDEAG